MPKTLIRFVALLLVPCVIGQVSFSASAVHAASTPPARLEISFDRQALMLDLTMARRTLFPRAKSHVTEMFTLAPVSLLGAAAAVSKASARRMRFLNHSGLVLEMAAGVAVWYFQPKASLLFIAANLAAVLQASLFWALTRRGHFLFPAQYAVPFLFFNAYASGSLAIGPGSWQPVLHGAVLVFVAYLRGRQGPRRAGTFIEKMVANKILTGWARSPALSPEHYGMLQEAQMAGRPETFIGQLNQMSPTDIDRMIRWRSDHGLEPWPVPELIELLPDPRFSFMSRKESSKEIYTIWSLGRSKDRRALPKLLALAENRFDLVGVAARDALLEFESGNEEIITPEVLLGILRSKHLAEQLGLAYGAVGKWPIISEKTSRRLLAGRYQLIECFAAGSHGQLYRAMDLRARHPVLLKIPKREVDHAVQLMRREGAPMAEISAAQRDAGLQVIPEFYEAGQVDNLGTPYIAMEEKKAVPLSAVIEEGRALDDDERLGQALHLTVGLLEQLSFVHKQGWVHGDLHVGNVLVPADSMSLPLLIDFSRATRIQEAGRPVPPAERWALSSWAPEQARPILPGPTADLYAVGRLLLLMASGGATIGRGNPIETMLAEVPALSRFPEDLKLLLRKAMATDPADRYQTAEEMWRAVEKLRSALPPPPAGTGGGRNSAMGSSA